MKNAAGILLVFMIFLSYVPLVQAAPANSPSLIGIKIFPEDHIWNTRVDNLPIDEKSDIYIYGLIKDTSPYTGIRHYIRNAIPYNVVNSTILHQNITGFCCNGAYFDNVPYPIPDNPLIEEGSSDHHMEIIDIDEMVLYELSAAQQLPNGSWSARYGAVWDLKGYSFRKNNVTPMWATSEAGLATFPGLVRYDEVSSGYINHSLRMGVPVLQNTWTWPARASAPLPSPYEPMHTPAGQRFRLKASYDISGYPPQAKVILQALKTYGAMASTLNGIGNPVTIIGSPDTRWNSTDLDTLRYVNISDFEAVNVSSLIIDQNSAQARQFPAPSHTVSSTFTPPQDQVPLNEPTNELSFVIIIIGCIGIFFILYYSRYLKK
jgi:hypothetical protein